jgi:transposase-like protein
MLVELGLVEQRYQAVLEVLRDGATVTDVARRYGVARQTVHDWLRKYASEGLRGLADRSSRPLSCPHQMLAEVEARIVEMRRAHPGVGAAHDSVLARARWCRAVAGAHVGGAVPDPPWARHTAAPEAEAL